MDIEHHQIDPKYRHLRCRLAQGLERLMGSLASEGQQLPVVVVAGESGRFVLIDGYRRVEALRRLGADLVRASLLELSEAEALIWSWSAARGGGRSVIEEAWLVRELHQAQGLELAELAIRFGRSRSWVSRRLALVSDLPEGVEAALRRGELSPQAAMKYLVPLARANAAQCAELVDNLKGERVSVRQLGRLYAAWRAGDDEQRRRIVAHPRLFLRAESELQADEVVETEDIWEKVVIRDLKMIAAIARRVCHQLQRRYRSASLEGSRLVTDGLLEARFAVSSLEPFLPQGSTA